MTDIPDYQLSDGASIPAIGLGTYSLTGDEGAKSVATAIGSGYRLLDSAVGYRNEDAVGAGMAQSGVPREHLRVTTKVPEDDHGYESTKTSLRGSLERLGTDYVDLYLIHWPEPQRNLYVETWRAMIELQRDGLARSIGVSNFSIDQLERLESETGVRASVNQVLLNPFHPNAELRTYHAAHGILTESYSPLKGAGRLAERDDVQALMEQHGATAEQLALRWNLQLGCVPIPRSRDAARQKLNIEVFEFELKDDEMDVFDALAS